MWTKGLKTIIMSEFLFVCQIVIQSKREGVYMVKAVINQSQSSIAE